MTTRNALVAVAGRTKELPSGDRLAGAYLTTVADTAPTTGNVVGDRWICSAIGTAFGVEFVYCDDGTSTQWVEFTGGTMFDGGTSFPTAPTNGQRFYRTDLHMACFYDGTYWLSEQMFEMTQGGQQALYGVVSSPNNTPYFVPRKDFGLYLERFQCQTYISSPNSATNYWSIDLCWVSAANVPTSFGVGFTTAADAAAAWCDHSAALGVVMNAATVVIRPSVTRVGTAGAEYHPCAIYYRLIVT